MNVVLPARVVTVGGEDLTCPFFSRANTVDLPNEQTVIKSSHSDARVESFAVGVDLQFATAVYGAGQEIAAAKDAEETSVVMRRITLFIFLFLIQINRLGPELSNQGAVNFQLRLRNALRHIGQ
jgi:hypothetical protein